MTTSQGDIESSFYVLVERQGAGLGAAGDATHGSARKELGSARGVAHHLFFAKRYEAPPGSILRSQDLSWRGLQRGGG